MKLFIITIIIIQVFFSQTRAGAPVLDEFKIIFFENVNFKGKLKYYYFLLNFLINQTKKKVIFLKQTMIQKNAKIYLKNGKIGHHLF